MNTNVRPSLTLYHANGKGTGSAVKLTLRPATTINPGVVIADIAPQTSLCDRSSTPPVYPRFDWDNALKVKLDFTDLAKVLQVLRGETESVDDGKGFFHRYADNYQLIKFRHMIEPVCGYSLEVYKTSTNDGERVNESTARIFLSNAEALGLSLAIEHSFAAIAFGVPVM